MSDNEAVNEKEVIAETRGGDRPSDYIKPIPPTPVLRADATDDDLDDES